LVTIRKKAEKNGKASMSLQKNKFWRLWAKALGEKAGKTDEESDRIAFIRTLIVLCYMITNAFIILGVIRHW
jgi:hypothetical protein